MEMSRLYLKNIGNFSSRNLAEIRKNAEIIHDWSVVKPFKADRMMDTRSIDGKFSDRDLFEFAINASKLN